VIVDNEPAARWTWKTTTMVAAQSRRRGSHSVSRSIRTSVVRWLLAGGLLTSVLVSVVDAARATTPQRSGYEDCAPVRVMPLGDSLTAGGAGDPQFYDSYRYELWRKLRAVDLPVVFVGDQTGPNAVATNPPPGSGLAPGSFAHSGHGGWTIGPNDQRDSLGRPFNVAAYIDEWTASVKPEVVLLNLGTNFELDGAAKLSALINKIRRLLPNAVIVTSSMTPFRGEIEKNYVTPERIALSEAAKTAGQLSATDRTLFADVRTRMIKGTDGVSAPFGSADYNQRSTTDEVHLSPAGGIKFAQAWFPEVDAAVRLVRPLPCAPVAATTPTTIPVTIPVTIPTTSPRSIPTTSPRSTKTGPTAAPTSKKPQSKKSKSKKSSRPTTRR
jgi:hypothetical protein